MLLFLSVLLLVYVLAGAFLVPRLLTGLLADRLSLRLNREVIITKAEFSPFTWKFALSNVLVGPDSQTPDSIDDPLFSVDRLAGTIAPAGLISGALILDDLTITAPLLHVVRNSDGRYNLTGALDRLRAQGPPFFLPPRLIPRRIILEQGTLLFDDLATGGHHSAENISLSLPALPSDMAEFASLPTTLSVPSLHATINGSPVDLLGEVRPGRQGADTVFHLSLSDFAIAPYRQHLPPPFREGMLEGTIDGALDFILSAAAEFTLGLQLDGRDLVLGDRSRPDRIDRISFEATVTPAARRLNCKELAVETRELHLVKQGDRWQRPAIADLASALAAALAQEQDWQIAVGRGRLRLAKATLSFRDGDRDFSLPLAQVELSLDNIAPAGPGAFHLMVGDIGGGRMEGGGVLRLSPLGLQGEFQIKRMDLLSTRPLLPLAITGGTLETLTSRLTAEGTILRFDELRATLRDLSVVEEGASNLFLPGLSIAQTTITTGDRLVAIGELATAPEPVQARLLLAEFPAPAPEPSAWRFTLGKGAIDRLQLSLERPGRPPLAIAIQQLQVQDLAADTPGTFTAKGQLAEGGDLALAGSLRLSPRSATVQAELSNLPLTAYPEIFSPWLHAKVTGGTLQAAGTVTLPETTMRGEAIIEDFAAAIEDKPALSWKRATVEDIDISARECTAGTVTVEQPALNWTVDGAGKVNLADLLAAPEPQADFRIALPEILLTDGTLTYTNAAMAPPAEVVIAAVNGILSDTESVAGNRTALELQGLSRQQALVAVSGSMGFSDPRLSAELTVRLSGQPLPPLSPYVQEGVGFELAGGTLDVQGDIHLAEGRITAGTVAKMTGLRLGRRLQGLSQLPLALALTTEADGSVTLDMPVEGDLSDHHFSWLGAMLQSVRNLALKAAVSPFSLLPQFSDGRQPTDTVDFSFGSSKLDADGKTRLGLFAEILRQRPQLQLVITGQADMRGDGEVLAKERPPDQKGAWPSVAEDEAANLARQAGGEVINRPAPEATKHAGTTQIEALARARAAQVARMLEASGIAAERIRVSDGILIIPEGSTKKPGNLVRLQLRVANGDGDR